jgi:hypothetical protein
LATSTVPRKSAAVLLPWVLRLAWLSLPVTAGDLLADAVDGRSTAVRAVVAALAWTAWAVVVLALLVPRPVGLTATRIVAPAAAVAAAWSAQDTGDGTVLAVLAAVPALLALLPEVGEWLVNGAAYGYERRYVLRAPGALLAGPIPAAWALTAGGAVVGPLLLAAGQWVAGGVALLVGVAIAYLCARALHSLTQRWAVLVPAGLVLKDHVTLLDPMLFKRTMIERLGPAAADTDAVDLTARSPGLALELALKEPEPVVLVQPGRKENQPGHVTRMLFTPSRPGALLADAGGRRIPVAQAAMPPPSTSSPS